MINPYWYFYSDNYLDAKSSGMGYTGIAVTGDIAGINRNPASLEVNNRYQASVQYTYKTNQPWLEVLGLDDLYLHQNLFSGSAGFGYKINKNFQLGFLYSNPTSLTLNVGTIIVTNEFGQEVGRYEADDKYVVHSFSLPFVYTTDMFKIGLSANYSLHRRYATYDNSDYTAKFDRLNVRSGIIFSPIKYLSLGMTFMPEISGTTQSNINNIAGDQNERVVIPMHFGAGISYFVKKANLRFAADYHFMKLSSRDELRDMNRIHFGMEYSVNKEWILRTGFFTYPDPRNMDGNWLNPQDNYDQIFLTLGATYSTKNMQTTLGLMDSHISAGVIKNIYINAGLTFNF
jgi:long-subunit fatty acid transport protein